MKDDAAASSSQDKAPRGNADSTKDTSSNRSFQLAQLLTMLPQIDSSKTPVTPLLQAVVNELVQWKTLQDNSGVDVKVKDMPLRMVLTRVEGKLNLVLYSTGELKQQLNEHHKELIAMLKKKDIDLSGLNVLELGDYVRQPGGKGNGQSGGQSGNPNSEKSLVTFDTLMKGADHDIANI